MYLRTLARWLCVWLIGAVVPCQAEGLTSTRPKREYVLTGKANGGVLVFAESSWSERHYVTVKTFAGEPAEAVITHLANAMSQQTEWSCTADGNRLIKPGSRFWVFTGSETGLGIPRPPLSVSASYDPNTKQVIMRWVNPPGTYDRTRSSVGNWQPRGAAQAACPVDYFEYGLNGAQLLVFNANGKTYSNFGIINVRTNAQEELNTSPFYCGIMPNWVSWSTSTNSGAAIFEQGTKPGVHPGNGVWNPDQKPFYQIVKIKASDVQAGVWRKFLGLTPGHTYRVSVRLNTLEMDATTNHWSLSFHAVCDAPGAIDLTTDQLAGKASLPDSSRGPAAGRMAEYGPGTTTRGQWILRTSDDHGPGQAITNLTLPAGVDTITVWLRHSGGNSTGVGIDWIKLEDLSFVTVR